MKKVQVSFTVSVTSNIIQSLSLPSFIIIFLGVAVSTSTECHRQAMTEMTEEDRRSLYRSVPR